MITLSPPRYILDILQTLEQNGHLAYLVGGCVRDLLLSQPPHDWDICTSAHPEQVLALFPGAIPTGLQHGTVTVRGQARHQLAEVTTFRAEEAYSDHRRPDQVSYLPNVEGDLSRRDFTMNAIALAKDGSLIDPFHGQRDIQQRCIRCVGQPDARFQEDALRMFRALRFSATLGFSIEAETLAAIHRHASLATFLAAERIRNEIEKALCSSQPQQLSRFFCTGLLDRFLILSSPLLTLSALAQLPRESLPRWAGLCTLLTEAGCIASAESFLTALRLDRATIRACTDGLAVQSSTRLDSVLACKRLIVFNGQHAAICAAAACAVHGDMTPFSLIDQILESNDCLSLKTLAVTGRDLMALGLHGREIGITLARLLDYVLEFPKENTREHLLVLVQAQQKED